MSDFKYRKLGSKPKKPKPAKSKWQPRKTKSRRKRELKNLAKGKKKAIKKQKGGGGRGAGEAGKGGKRQEAPVQVVPTTEGMPSQQVVVPETLPPLPSLKELLAKTRAAMAQKGDES